MRRLSIGLVPSLRGFAAPLRRTLFGATQRAMQAAMFDYGSGRGDHQPTPAPPKREPTEEVDSPDEHQTYVTDAEKEEWTMKNTAKYGEDVYPAYRALYKDLCDEMRREIHAKPPAPYDNIKVEHEPGSKFIIFRRPEDKENNRAPYFAWGEVKLADPSMKNDQLQFVNWYPIEVCFFRNGLVLHLSCANVEQNFHVRNLKIYEDKENVLGSVLNLDVNFVRDFLKYNGPYVNHLEDDFQQELWDVALDHGINPDTVRFFAEWVYYIEHVEYSRWNNDFREHLLPGGVEKEEDVLTRDERMELDLASEEWLPIRDM